MQNTISLSTRGKSLELYSAIVGKFVRIAKSRESEPVVVVLPDPEIVRYYRETAMWIHMHLVTEAQQQGASVLNMGPIFTENLGEDTFQSLMSANHHHNSKGDAILATSVYDFLRNL